MSKMVGVRIRHLPDQCLEKVLKIYFSKPEHGGGKIKKIYFPLMNNDAVIIFEDQKVIQTITQYQHKMSGRELEIEPLPEHMIFSTMEAKVDTNASVILQVSQKLRDEMEFGENIRITENEDQTYSLKGNWFQLEWAWQYLDSYMKHQEVIQSQIEQAGVSQGQPVAMEIDDLIEEKWKTYRVRPSSPTEVNSTLRKNIAERSKVEETLRSSRSPQQPVKVGSSEINLPGNERSVSPGHGHSYEDADRKSSKEEAKLYHKSIGSPHESLIETSSPHTSLRRSPSPQVASTSVSRHEGTSLIGLKDNINRSYAGVGNASSLRGNPDDYDTEDEIEELQGQPHNIPFESVHSSLGIGNRERKSDENKTFENFSASSYSSHLASKDTAVKAGFKSDPSSQRDLKDRLHMEPTPSRKSHLDVSHGYGPLFESSQYGATASPRLPKDIGASRQDVSKTASSSIRSQSKLPDQYSSDQLQCQFQIKDITVTVYFGNLLQETAEAIVNAANSDLDHLGGIAYHISKARGPEMERECREYIRKNGNLKVSEVTHTSGGGEIKAQHIIHAYGPMWLGEESKDKSANQLRATFLNCFEYAEIKLWIRSLSTPAISTGVFGVPLDICVRSFLDATLIFKSKHKNSRLTDIRLVSNDAESTVTAIVLLQTLLDTGIDKLTAEALDTHRQFTEKSSMNLPRGRPETSDFSRSYLQSRPGEIMSSISQKRRSSSTSRVSDRKRTEEDAGQRSLAYDSKTYFEKGLVHKDLGSNKTEDRGRTRTQSSTESKSQHLNDMNTDRQSSRVGRAHTSAEQSHRTVPQIKSNLLVGIDKLTTRKPSSSANTRSTTRPKSSAVRVKDDYKLRESPESDLSDDNYSRDLPGRHYLGNRDDDFGLQSLPVNLGQHDSSFREKFLQLNSEEKTEKKVDICAICLDKVRKPKVLSKCGHTFCTGCIEAYFSAAKPKCPTCGVIYGQIKGDQPKGGNMTTSTDRQLIIPGYEREDGAIIINYTFPGGIQESCHPRPGRSYKGFSRKAYLPNSVEGREILRLLKRAFQAQLTFTIGESRTTGDSGVITWNDIHHKTSVKGGPTKFGYPDRTYLKRVREELASKGIV